MHVHSSTMARLEGLVFYGQGLFLLYGLVDRVYITEPPEVLILIQVYHRMVG